MSVTFSGLSRRAPFPFAAAVALLVATASPGGAVPGDLDPAFSGDGKVTTDLGGRDSARGVAIQADGRIVAAGYVLIGSFFDFGLARYNTNGSMDTTFDGDGRVTTDFGGTDAAEGIAIRGDRRLVAVGCTSCLDASDFAVARYKICRTSSRRSSIPC